MPNETLKWTSARDAEVIMVERLASSVSDQHLRAWRAVARRL